MNNNQHKTREQLASEILEASKMVEVGGRYFHYKHPEQDYIVLHLGFIEASDELCVIYEAQYDDKPIFVRPLSSWLETVETEKGVVGRFTKK